MLSPIALFTYNRPDHTVKQVKEYVCNESFMLAYGDGVSDVNIEKLFAFHKSYGKLVTMSAYNAERLMAYRHKGSGSVWILCTKRKF